MYARLDNHFDQHPKIVAAGWKGGWLFTTGICYASRMLTDGFIPTGMVPRLVAGMPGWKKAAAMLVQLGLWQEVEGGYRIHDYLDYQEARADVERKRKYDRERKATDDDAKTTVPPPLASVKIPRGIRAESIGKPPVLSTDSATLDRDVDRDPHTDQKHSDHDQQEVFFGKDQKTTNAAPPLAARPEMAALVTAVRQKAHLEPEEDDGEVAATVQLHLDLWPAEVLEDQALAFDAWANNIERKGKTVARTAKSLGTFFGKIDPKKLARARRNPSGMKRPIQVSHDGPLFVTPEEHIPWSPKPPSKPPRKMPNGHRINCHCQTCNALRETEFHRRDCTCGDCHKAGYLWWMVKERQAVAT